MAIQKREEPPMNERSALNSAKKQGIEQGIAKRNAELIEKWKKKGYTDEQIKELLSE